MDRTPQPMEYSNSAEVLDLSQTKVKYEQNDSEFKPYQTLLENKSFKTDPTPKPYSMESENKPFLLEPKSKFTTIESEHKPFLSEPKSRFTTIESENKPFLLEPTSKFRPTTIESESKSFQSEPKFKCYPMEPKCKSYQIETMNEYRPYPMAVTPPHGCYPAVPLPLRYPPQVMTYSTVTDSSDDASDMSSTSPPAMNPVSSTFMITNTVMNTTRSGKPTRPFKAYPKDFLVGSSSTDALLGSYSNDEYLEFRRKMLSQIQSVSNKSNANMKRSSSPQHPTSTGEDDARSAAYWERRRKNNEAAKRSRDARRAKEDEIAIRAAFLEQENMRLKYEVTALREETTKLRCLVYNR